MAVKGLFKAARKRLVNLVCHPFYPGLYLRSESFRGALAYFNASKLLRAKEVSRRRHLMRALPTTGQHIDPKIGFVIIDMTANDAVSAAIAVADSRLRQRLERQSVYHGNKPYLYAYSIDDLDDPAVATLRTLATLPEIISPIAKYLGMLPVLQQLTLCHSPNDQFEGGRSYCQIWCSGE